MKAARRGVLALAVALACHPAGAFGPKTHLWIGHQVLNDLQWECNVALNSVHYRVAPGLCGAIASNPESFYAGALGPDIYPDLIAGQNTTHSGVKDGWNTAEFLEHVVSSASTPASRAYAAGYLVHAASDVFGHSYVNAYAGDVWNLSDERRVELRHTAIEKYIDAHLPPMASGATPFRAPAEFVRDTLVHNNRLKAQYQRTARHLASMTSVKATIDDLAARAETLSSLVPDALAKHVESGITLTAQLLDGEAALAVLSAVLEGRKSEASAQHDLLAIADKQVTDATDAVVEHETRLKALATQAQAQQEAAAAASSAAQQASNAANELRTSLSALANQIRSVPPKVVDTACRGVTDPVCNTLCPKDTTNPLCAVCNLSRETCISVERSNEEFERLNRRIDDAKQRLGALESAAAQEQASAAAARVSANALAPKQAIAAAAGPGMAAARSAAEATHRAAAEQYKRMADGVATTQQRIDELRRKVEATRKDLVDARAVADQLRQLAAQLNLLSHVLHGWQRGIDHAGNMFVSVSDRVGRGMLDGNRHAFSEYRRWLACEGAIYLAAPYHVADVSCSIEIAAQGLPAVVRDMANTRLPEPLKDVYARIDELRSRIDTELQAAIAGATRELVQFVSDPATADFVDLLANPERAARDKLDEALATAADAKGKDILIFSNGADLIDRDIGLANGMIDPKAFAALASAVTLSKLALLDQAEIKRLILEVGGPDALARYDQNGFDVGPSILLTAVRSLDGNEQWQPYGLPYPRGAGAGAPAEASDRRYGFGWRDAGRRGFPLFMDAVLRQRVFLKLFPKQIHGEVAKRPEMAPGRYPFPICDANPFPVTFLPNGDAAPGDSGCANGPAVQRDD